jgi:hypothetical protein
MELFPTNVPLGAKKERITVGWKQNYVEHSKQAKKSESF